MSYKWDEVHSLNQAFGTLLNSEFMSDVKFEFSDEKIIFAHIFVLCLRSSKFHEQLAAEKNKADTIKVKVEYADYEIFLEFLSFLYTEKCAINTVNAIELLKLSKAYEVADLEVLCREIVLGDLRVETAFDIVDKSLREEWTPVKQESLEFIAKNFRKFLNDPKFLEINTETLCAILRLDDVSDTDEVEVYEALIKWARHVSQKEMGAGELNVSIIRDKAEEGLKCIRFGSMTAMEFEKCRKLEKGLFTKEEVAAICSNIITKEKNSIGISDIKRNQIKSRYDIWTGVYLENLKNSYPVATEFALELSVSAGVDLIGIKIDCPNGTINLRVMDAASPDPLETIDVKCNLGVQTLDFKKAVRLEPQQHYRLLYTFTNLDGETVKRFDHEQYLPCTSPNSQLLEFTFYQLSPHIFHLHYEF